MFYKPKANGASIIIISLAMALWADLYGVSPSAMKTFQGIPYRLPSAQTMALTQSSRFHGGQTTVQKMVKDSVAFFMNETHSYAPGGIAASEYSSDGIELSYITTVMNDSLSVVHGMENSKTLYTFDQQRNIWEIISQSLIKGVWVNKSKMLFSPYLGVTPLREKIASGQGFSMTCTAMNLFLSMQFMTLLVWDTITNTWKDDFKDSLKTISPEIKILNSYTYDTASNSFTLIGFDTLFLSNSRVVKTVLTLPTSTKPFFIVDSAIYDNSGRPVRGNQRIASSMGNTASIIVQTYDTHGYLIASISQDSSASGWIAMENCPKRMYTYDYDNSGMPVSRLDSAWYSPDSIVVEKHFFTYQAFAMSILPRNYSNPKNENIVSVDRQGMVITNKPVVLGIYSLSGKRIAETTITASGPLWKSVFSKGTSICKGLYIVKSGPGQTEFCVWRE